MGALRTVLIGEGGGELGGESTLLPAPGEPLDEPHIGAGHLLVRRCISKLGGIPEGAVRLESPLRLRARVPRGSDLLDRRNLRQLVTYASPGRRPDLAVVLVDADGDANARKKLLQGHLEGLSLPTVVAVAAQSSRRG